jgi:hypothetical protein
MDTLALLDRFPKVRPPLSERIQAIYAEHYKSNRSGGTPAASLSQKMERWLHVSVAADRKHRGNDVETLELGAGTLNQLPYEEPVGKYDVVEPFTALYADSPHRAKVRDFFADMADVPKERRYDRITSVATFEHITNLPEVVAWSGLLLKEGGQLRTSIPSEGTPLWTLGWMMTTGLEFRLRYGADYGELMRHEHVNTAAEIEAVLRYFFGEVSVRCFGLGRWLSLYQFIECRAPKLEICRAYLAS